MSLFFFEIGHRLLPVLPWDEAGVKFMDLPREYV